jgi:TfoX/Sxy family transcriptional regulator of competence genes
LADQGDLVEKKMFGGLCFMVNARMCVGIVKDKLMVKVGAANDALALAQPHARPMDFTGKPMKGFVFVAPPGFEEDARLQWWVSQAVAFARTSQTKKKAARARRSNVTGVRRARGS